MKDFKSGDRVLKIFRTAVSVAVIGLFALASPAMNSYAGDAQSVERAASGEIARLSTELHKLKVEKSRLPKAHVASQTLFLETFLNDRHRCDPPQEKCVPKCNSRYSDGSCGSYGSDYCDADAACVPKCNSRYSDGSCGSYGGDFCGPDATCSVKCNSRYSDGSCGSYGADICN